MKSQYKDKCMNLHCYYNTTSAKLENVQMNSLYRNTQCRNGSINEADPLLVTPITVNNC